MRTELSLGAAVRCVGWTGAFMSSRPAASQEAVQKIGVRKPVLPVVAHEQIEPFALVGNHRYPTIGRR